MRSLSRAICFLCLLSFAVMPAKLGAQGPVGTLNGTILDPAGAVVPGATVGSARISSEHSKPFRTPMASFDFQKTVDIFISK
jgi:hypothetical protein